VCWHRWFLDDLKYYRIDEIEGLSAAPQIFAGSSAELR
jgi:hypothetical protein